MKKQIKDGWHNLCGYYVYIEDEKIMHGIIKDRNGSYDISFPYRKYGNGWSSEVGISCWSFISGVRRGTVGMFEEQ